MHSINKKNVNKSLKREVNLKIIYKETRETLNTKENETHYHVYGTVYRNYYLSDTVKNTSE